MSSNLSAAAGCGTHFWLHDHTWVAGDLSAASVVVLISLDDLAWPESGPSAVLIACDNVMSTIPNCDIMPVHVTYFTAGSECSLGCGTHFSRLRG